MFDASAATLLGVAADPKHLGAEIGLLSILHTWGQTLQRHPHIHCVVPGGGLSPDHLSFAKTHALCGINDIAAVVPFSFCYNCASCFDMSSFASERWFALAFTLPVTKDRYIKAFDPAVLAAMKRMETTLDAIKLCAPTVHQIN